MAGSIEQDFAVEALRRCALFTLVDADTLRECAATLRVRRFRRGETIFHQGDPGDSLYIIESGSVKIVLPSPEGEEAAIIATLSRGDFFGELALLDGAPHSATAVALEIAEMLVLRRERFEALIDSNRALRMALLAGLSAELRRLTGHVEELHFLDLPGRLARRLVTLANDVVPNATGEIRLAWPYTQSDLASMIGGTRQTVNRLLADLVDQGLIRFDDRESVVIPSVERLARAAER
jgi:CRP/FNR family transcriptional regulator/CRP/FNR family cyclic AMP-dependent transcriptional regulator